MPMLITTNACYPDAGSLCDQKGKHWGCSSVEEPLSSIHMALGLSSSIERKEKGWIYFLSVDVAQLVKWLHETLGSTPALNQPGGGGQGTHACNPSTQ